MLSRDVLRDRPVRGNETRSGYGQNDQAGRHTRETSHNVEEYGERGQ